MTDEQPTTGTPGRFRVVSASDAEFEPWPGTREEILDGDPAMRIQILWSSADGCAANGIWRADPSKVGLVHPFDETFVVLEGSLTIDVAGSSRTMGPGDTIVIPEGTRSIWTIHQTVTKMFAIHREGGLPA